MTRTELLDSSGNQVQVSEGASANVDITLYDASGDALAKASITSLTMDLFNDADDSIINSLDGVDILDASIGTVTTAGVVTLKLRPGDNPIVDSSLESEIHVIRLYTSWTDSGAVNRNSISEFEFSVRNLVDTVATPSTDEPGWIG